ncbi:hypothetical protein CIK84_06430 [Glutamicibacter arilaitensis]|uniref:Polysaccharide chain length determinant N-terminal domain-containing protein n=2 Tax=Glutamicibacter arilaitensis TaxID=256701 RepID=A0A2N7S4X6_9MICC|nr:hypothetical protein CIK84_06430 [Glutamicibacter arilaitensis]
MRAGGLLSLGTSLQCLGDTLQKIRQPMLLSEIWGRIVFRWKTVCAVVVLAIVGAVAFGVFSGTDYSAKTVLTVNPLTTNPFSSATANQQINITTERAILSSSEVARRAVADLGDETSAASLSENARIEAPQGSQILTVTVVDTDPQLAADKANALAAAYLEFRAEGAAQVADTYIKAIDERIESLSKSETNGSTFDLALADLVNQRNDLALVAENPGRIIGYADEAETSSNSSLVLYAAAGLTGGLILGLIAAVLRDRLSKVVGNADRLAQATGLAVVTMRNASDREGIRWVLRSQMQAGNIGARYPKSIGVLALGRTPEVKLRGLLWESLQARRLHSHSMSLAAIPAEALDGGWPDSTEECAWVGMDAVLTGIPADMADSRIALLCDRFLDSLVLFVDQSTPLAAVSRRLDFLAGMTHGSICLVFIEQCQGHSERLPSQDLREMKIEESVGAI